MIRTVHFDHKVVAGFHVITSPDVVGFHVTGRTAEEAEREAVAVLDFSGGRKVAHPSVDSGPSILSTNLLER